MAAVDTSLVADLPMFAGFSGEDLAEILREARSARYRRNSEVFSQGEDAHSFFLLLHGHVRASKTTPTGEQVVMRYVSPGEIFGVAPALGLKQYPATATAVDDSVALAWPSAAWPRLVAKFPALATNTLRYGRAEEQAPQRNRFFLRPLIDEAAAAALPAGHRPAPARDCWWPHPAAPAHLWWRYCP